MVDIRESSGTFDGDQFVASTARPLSVLVTPRWRRMNPRDLPWLHDLCRRRYAEDYDDDHTQEWFLNIVLRNPLMFYAVRSENAFTVAYINTFPWLPGAMECNITFICADDGKGWEALMLLRQTVAWAKKRNCKWWNLASDTDTDLGPIARRIGAREVWPRYRMELR